ncbi:hypothetical protein CLOM_g22756 [Closterium sp. NIES-68]|nr:hypothetical protein CLOM_g22756 [Closterium sp. NIES-68]GJP60571.1 hypothetical protein CLOP_g17811 [Closterium sp. NIES-67]
MVLLSHRSASLPQLHPWVRGLELEDGERDDLPPPQEGGQSPADVLMDSDTPDGQQAQQQQQQQQGLPVALGPRSVAISLTVNHAFGFASPAALPPPVLSGLAALTESAQLDAGGRSERADERAEGSSTERIPGLGGIPLSETPASHGDGESVCRDATLRDESLGPNSAPNCRQWSGQRVAYSALSMLLPCDPPAATDAPDGAADRAVQSATQQTAPAAAAAPEAAASAAVAALVSEAASLDTLGGAPAADAHSSGLAGGVPAAAAEPESVAGEGEGVAEGGAGTLLAVEVRWKGVRAGLMGSMFGRAVKRGCSSAQPPRGPYGMVRWEEGFAHDCHLLPCPAALRASRGQGEPCSKGCLFQPWEVMLLVHKHDSSRPRDRPQQVASVVLDLAPLAAPLHGRPLTHHLLVLFAPTDSPPVGLLQVEPRPLPLCVTLLSAQRLAPSFPHTFRVNGLH